MIGQLTMTAAATHLSVDLSIFVFVLFDEDLLAVGHSPATDDAMFPQVLYRRHPCSVCSHGDKPHPFGLM